LEVTLSLKDVVTGCTKSLRFFRDELCEECHGTGAKDGKTKTCERCHGTGVVENRQSTPFGVFITQTTCPTCHGAGSVPEQVCPVCHGTGVVKRQRTLDLQIPPGIENNDVITLKDKATP